MKKLSFLLLCAVLTFAMVCPALAAESDAELTAAAAHLKEQGIMVGNQDGDMDLDSGLTRAQLATILTRLNGDREHIQADQTFYISQCKFTDVPVWAKLYVGYCYFNSLMVGYDTGVFGADDGVTPAAACTVVLGTWIAPTSNGTIPLPVRPPLTKGLLLRKPFPKRRSPAEIWQLCSTVRWATPILTIPLLRESRVDRSAGIQTVPSICPQTALNMCPRLVM